MFAEEIGDTVPRLAETFPMWLTNTCPGRFRSRTIQYVLYAEYSTFQMAIAING